MSHFSSTEILERLLQNTASQREVRELRQGWAAFVNQLNELEEGEVFNCEMLGSFYRSNGRLEFRPAPVLSREINHRYEGQRPIVLDEGYQADLRPTAQTSPPLYRIEDTELPAKEPDDAGTSDSGEKAEEDFPNSPAEPQEEAEPDNGPDDEPDAQPPPEPEPEPASTEPDLPRAEPATPEPDPRPSPESSTPRRMIEPAATSPKSSDSGGLFSETALSRPGEMPLSYRVAGIGIVLLMLAIIGYLVLNYSIYGGYSASIPAEEAEQAEQNELSGQAEAPAGGGASISATPAGNAPADTLALPEEMLPTEESATPELPLLPEEPPLSTGNSLLYPDMEFSLSPALRQGAGVAADSPRVADVAGRVDLSDSLVPPGDYGLRGNMQRVRGVSYGIVVHSLSSRRRAIEQDAALNIQGYRTITYPVQTSNGGQTWRVSVGQFESAEAAQAAVEELPESYRSSYFISQFQP